MSDLPSENVYWKDAVNPIRETKLVFIDGKDRVCFWNGSESEDAQAHLRMRVKYPESK